MMQIASKLENVVQARVPDAIGTYRLVWLEDGYVIKMDRYNLSDVGFGACNDEFYKSKLLRDTKFFFEGEEWTFRFPKVDMVKDYLIMERIDLGGRHGFGCDCDLDNVDEIFWIIHALDCVYSIMETTIRYECQSRFNLVDIHPDNYKVDLENKTVWLIDFSS